MDAPPVHLRLPMSIGDNRLPFRSNTLQVWLDQSPCTDKPTVTWEAEYLAGGDTAGSEPELCVRPHRGFSCHPGPQKAL